MRRSIYGPPSTHAFGPAHHKPAPVELDLFVGSVTQHELRHDTLVKALSHHVIGEPGCLSAQVPDVGSRVPCGSHWSYRKTEANSSGLTWAFKVERHSNKAMTDNQTKLWHAIDVTVERWFSFVKRSRAVFYFVAQSIHSIATSSPKRNEARLIKNVRLEFFPSGPPKPSWP